MHVIDYRKGDVSYLGNIAHISYDVITHESKTAYGM